MLELSHLNPAQYEAVTALDGPVLVIAGAGSGKTRTLVYRLAWLTEQGASPDSMLLLTFTRKAAQEMLHRAAMLLVNSGLSRVQGGTFHGFAYSLLRHFSPSWSKGGLTIMDSADSAACIQHCKENLKIGKGDRSFPKSQTVLGIISKSRNKEMDVEEVLRREAQHLLPHADALQSLADACRQYRRDHNLLDYDDLLFELENTFHERPDILDMQRRRFQQVLVDEYQDTNMVQARLVHLLAGTGQCNVMAVGDDAQSIYAFRGATVNNILEFPQRFENTKIIRLEENYRSLQGVLNIANKLLEDAPVGYRKQLFSKREQPEELPVHLYRPLDDNSQAYQAAQRIQELLEVYQAGDIAVLFRAGYQSYRLEVVLSKLGIGFKKYGGLRFTEAAHIKDVLAFMRLVVNPLDLPAFERVAALTKGIGPKTAIKLYQVLGDGPALQKLGGKYPDFLKDIAFLDYLQSQPLSPEQMVESLVEHYRPRLEELFVDDWPRRLLGLEEMQQMAAEHEDLKSFLGAVSLDNPEEAVMEEESRVTLSTVHSAKGLEWGAVLILDLVEDRFPSRHALVRPEEFEEERRLLYVACTRAKDSLDLFVPLSITNRSNNQREPATPSPFVRELPPNLMDEIYENYAGALLRRKNEAPKPSLASPKPWTAPAVQADNAYLADIQENPHQERPGNAGPVVPPEKLGYCHHKIFGRGKIVEALPPDKFRVNFPGLGLKVILGAYLKPEN